jgi:NAD(P)H-hydrate epimerase
MMPSDSFLRHALLTCAQMRKAEAASCAQGPLAFYDLMQNAGRAVAQAVMERWQPCRVLILCGPGNNGGDGHVAAEVLRKAGWPVVVGALAGQNPPQEAARAAAAWTGESLPLTEDLFEKADVVVDALFGTGLQRPIEGDIARIIARLNARRLPVVAADMPSGIDGDTGRVLGVATRAQVTVTFFRKKLGHVLLPGAALCGDVVVADTGQNGDSLDGIDACVAENDPDLWLSSLPWPRPGGHKFSRGHALVYGGPAMTGASRLAARAAQRIGAGLVTLAAPACATALYAASLESVLVRQAESLDEWRALVNDPKKTTELIGPGAGVDAAVRAFVLESLATDKPCVLDADALTVFADEPEVLFKALPPACVLTPHEGEFHRLFESLVDAKADKLTRARQAAGIAGCCVLLKGADTVIAMTDGRAVINHNAPPWLATAGAGDVLGGMIAGLLAAGMPPFAAAAAAAWLHGETAAAAGLGLIAEDLVGGIPAALKGLSERL